MDAVSNVNFTRVDDCCKKISWNEPYSLDGIPVLGYKITSKDLNIDTNVTGNTEAEVCSAQLQQHNATVIIQAYNGVDGVNSSIELDFDIGKCMLIDLGKSLLVFMP